MAFQYRFATLLQLRRRERDQAGAAVGQADEAIRRVELQVEEIQRERESLREGYHQRLAGQISVDGLLAQGRYDLQLEAELQALDKTRGELIQELQRRQRDLVTAEAEVKRFEKLEEKDRMAFRTEQLRQEQALSDDATCCRTIMDRRR